MQYTIYTIHYHIITLLYRFNAIHPVNTINISASILYPILQNMSIGLFGLLQHMTEDLLKFNPMDSVVPLQVRYRLPDTLAMFIDMYVLTRCNKVINTNIYIYIYIYTRILMYMCMLMAVHQ